MKIIWYDRSVIVYIGSFAAALGLGLIGAWNWRTSRGVTLYGSRHLGERVNRPRP